MAKIASGIIILRKGGSTDWTTELDNEMNAWTKEYITWLETAKIALDEKAADKYVLLPLLSRRTTVTHYFHSNHGTFYYNQLAALKVMVGDNAGALEVTNTYFGGQYLFQIKGNGEQVNCLIMLALDRCNIPFSQPLEAARTRPYHYRAYNLAAMIVTLFPTPIIHRAHLSLKD
jgi:hypothetical protein